ncbi:MAG: HAMP domain-containing histidine kinase [Oscillospiraceae bacterium]|nr:HAMP domain-containing histidine kinase [Oscillospiraceae bacterium]
MIYRLRRRFILICTGSLLAVFLIMMAAIQVTHSIRQNKQLDVLADILSENDGRFPMPSPKGGRRSPEQPDFINAETLFTTRFYLVTVEADGTMQIDTEHVSDVSEEEAAQTAAEVLRKDKERGWCGDYRYKLYEADGMQRIIFISGKMERTASRGFMQSILIVFGACSLAVLGLIIVLSRFAVRPAAESYEKQKQFDTDANHELKTPLTLILTNVDIAESELGPNEWLDDIRTEGERMSKLVNRLVTLSRMDEEQQLGDQAEFDLSAAVSETVDEFAELASMCGKELTADIDPGIRYCGNEAEIRQLAAILLDNAVKYCDPGGSIHAELRQKKRPVLIVMNACQSVDSIRLDRLFDRFYREDTARTAGSGFGIGLSIAQSIAGRHKGSIRAVKTEPGVIGFIVKL